MKNNNPEVEKVLTTIAKAYDNSSEIITKIMNGFEQENTIKLPENIKVTAIEAGKIDEARIRDIGVMSIEAGHADAKNGDITARRHFDHHGTDHVDEKGNRNPSPANDLNLRALAEENIVDHISEIVVTHLDADSLVATLGVLSKGEYFKKLEEKGIKTEMIELMDMESGYACKDKMDPAYLYVKGLSQLELMRWQLRGKGELDITDYIEALANVDIDAVVQMGQIEHENMQKAFDNALSESYGEEGHKTGVFKVSKDDKYYFNTEAAYDNGYDTCIIARKLGENEKGEPLYTVGMCGNPDKVISNDKDVQDFEGRETMYFGNVGLQGRVPLNGAKGFACGAVQGTQLTEEQVGEFVGTVLNEIDNTVVPDFNE